MSQVAEVAHCLQLLGLGAASEEACAAVVYEHMQELLEGLARG